MHSPHERHHRKITGLLASVVGIGLSLYLAIAGISYQAESDQLDLATHQNAFWQVVAGEEAPTGIEPDMQLARALNEDLDIIEVPTDFVAAPNAYRGVTNNLGFNPFNEEGLGCNECGPLTQEVFAQVQLVQEQGSRPLLLDLETFQPNLSLTGINFFVELIIVWTILGTIGMLLGLKLFGAPGMTWRRGDDIDDGHELVCIILAPVFMLIFLATYNRSRLQRLEDQREEQLKRKNLFDVYDELNRAIIVIEGSKPNSPGSLAHLSRLREMRDNIVAVADAEDDAWELRKISTSTVAGHDTALLRKADDALRARQETLRELES